MNLDAIVKELTLEEKAALLTGATSMTTGEVEKLKLKAKRFADGPHGVRTTPEDKCTAFPNLCCVGATWDRALVYQMGQALGDECIEHGIDMLLAPGINIKRTPLCGRNFEYFSEDPLISGEMGAAFINGLQSRGVGASLKHYALNNQEIGRNTVSVEIDLRVMREIYLKGFEIAIKKSNPQSVMCSYNKVFSVWASENKYLLTDILKKEWGYEGFVVSDWGAVQDICRCLCAGLDLQMPRNENLLEQVTNGLQEGRISMEVIDGAVKAMLRFLYIDKAQPAKPFNRAEQHKLARKIAADGIVLLENRNNALPLTSKKYKKIAVMGEYAVAPLISGQGAAEVYPGEENIDNPLEELKKALGDDVEITYLEAFKRGELPSKMIWPQRRIWEAFVKDADAVVIFAGSMESEDTEQFDRLTTNMNPNIEYVIDRVCKFNPNVIVVLQSGSALIPGPWRKKANALVQMWLGGESAGGAIADVLTGKVNPSGRLTETFALTQRTDLEYPGDGNKVRYSEGFDIGYRYYDKHPEQIAYPFGFGRSYTNFAYSDFSVTRNGNQLELSATVSNTGEVDGCEVIQIYVAKEESLVTRAVKDLKAFEKVFVKAGQSALVTINLDIQELAYYNIMLNQWIVEPGEYEIMFAVSARDLLHSSYIQIDDPVPYSMKVTGTTMIG
jgi:beta-glucosidase